MSKQDNEQTEAAATAEQANPYAADEAAGTGAAAVVGDEDPEAAQRESNARVSGDDDTRGGSKAQG